MPPHHPRQHRRRAHLCHDWPFRQLRAESPSTAMPDFPAKQRMATVFQSVSLEERRAKLEAFLQVRGGAGAWAWVAVSHRCPRPLQRRPV